MPRKPKEVEIEDEVELEAEPEESEPRSADVPFDPWGSEEEENDRRRDPLRNPVA